MTSLRQWYPVLKSWFTILPPIVAPVTIFINAPFGRFTPKSSSIFQVDGIKSWIIMELVSPITFLLTFYRGPLNLIPDFNPQLKWNQPTTVLAAFFLVHYFNRAIISPLRTPSRSKSHLIVPLAAGCFNLVNGFLMGAYLSSPSARAYTQGAFYEPLFWIKLGLAGAGLVGNIWHDEILMNIRRKAKSGKKDDDSSNGDAKKDSSHGNKKEHYSIPHGALFTYISFPNYTCEWFEWLFFAVASSPFPALSLINPISITFSAVSPFFIKSVTTSWETTSWSGFIGTLHPPWIFLASEVLLMLPRAIKGHRWYKETFGEAYPRERWAVLPGLI